MCRSAPEPGSPRCPGCGRALGATKGGLDLLDDAEREAADRFAAWYTALRRREGWVGQSGREDPAAGEPRLWSGRLEAVTEAVAALRRQWRGVGRPVVIDIGSGGGWAARYLRDADVIALDLVAADRASGALSVRGDMRRLPVRDAAVDAVFYAASLHYAPVKDAIREAARVLRPIGLVVAVDSPMYGDARAQARAKASSKRHYANAGFPDLAEHYHPIDVTALRGALAGSGFTVLRLDPGRSGRRWWERLGRSHRSSFLVARRD